MKEFILLLKLQFKIHFRSGEKKEGKNKVATPIIIGLSMIPLLSIICYSLYMTIYAGVSANIVPEILVLILTSAQLFTLFFVSKVYISTFYNSDDNEFLATLPATPVAQFFSKIIVVYISELSFNAFLLLPTLITAAVAMNVAGMVVPVVFYFYIPLFVLFAPLIPLAIISILAAPIMYIASFFKNRGAISSIMSILLFIVLMGGYFALVPNFANISNLQNGIPPQAVQIFKQLGNVMYFNKVFCLASLNIEFTKNFFICLAIIVGCILFSLLLTLLMFRRSVSAQFETHSKNKSANLEYKSQSVKKSLLQNDFKSLIRLPGLALNSFLGLFMVPLILIAMYAFSNGSIANTDSADSAELFSQQVMIAGFVMMYTLMLNIGMNYVASLSFTREGKSFCFLKHLPIDFKDILQEKQLFADIVSGIGIIIVMIVSLALYKMNPFSSIAMGIILFIFAKGMNMYSIYRDMKRPNLEWKNINEAIKRNYYIMVPFFISMCLGILAIIIASTLSVLEIYLSQIWIVVIFYAIMLAIGVLVYFLSKNVLYKNAEHLFESMGEPGVIQTPKVNLKNSLKFKL